VSTRIVSTPFGASSLDYLAFSDGFAVIIFLLNFAEAVFVAPMSKTSAASLDSLA
jgi:hypothetical protein